MSDDPTVRFFSVDEKAKKCHWTNSVITGQKLSLSIIIFFFFITQYHIQYHDVACEFCVHGNNASSVSDRNSLS